MPLETPRMCQFTTGYPPRIAPTRLRFAYNACLNQGRRRVYALLGPDGAIRLLGKASEKTHQTRLLFFLHQSHLLSVSRHKSLSAEAPRTAVILAAFTSYSAACFFPTHWKHAHTQFEILP